MDNAEQLRNSFNTQIIPNSVLVETITKAGIITGIIFAGFVMILLGITILPNIVNNYDHDPMLSQSGEELEEILTESEEYVAFAERFPDYAAEFHRGKHDAWLQMGALNLETGNALVMDLRYHEYDGPYIDKSIHCEYGAATHESDRYERPDHASGVLVKLYVEKTKCLD